MSDTDRAEPVSFPEPPPELRKHNWLKLFAFFGPGAIMASVTIASGETLFASRGGAIFGYTILWCLLAGAIMKGVQVYGGMRFMVVTGFHPMESWAHLPGPRAWAPILIGILSVVCFPFWLAGLPKMLGQLTNWICHIPQNESTQAIERLWATFFIAVGVTITLLQTYRFLEKAETVVVGILLVSILMAVIAAHPDWVAAALGAVIPRVPHYEAWVVEKYPAVAQRPHWVEVITYMGAVGGGTYDYLGYLGMLREKAWGMLDRAGRLLSLKQLRASLPESPVEVKKSRVWLRAPIIDCSVSFTCVLLFTAAFLILGAKILHPREIIPEGTELLSHQAKFLTRIHAHLLYVYQVGVFMAFFGTIVAAYEVYTRTASECLRAIAARWRDLPLRRVRLWVVIYCGVFGLLLVWTCKDPVKIVTIPALLGGVFTCGLWCFAVLWGEHHFLPKAYRMKRWLFVATIIAGIAMTTFGVVALYQHFGPPIAALISSIVK